MAFERAFGVALILASLLFVRTAWSDAPTAEERETARAMMDDGHAKRDGGDHKAALLLFQGADAIMHVPTTGLEVARELVSLGQLVEARDYLQRVIHTPTTEGEPEAFRNARLNAMALDDDLVKRIPALAITVSGVPPGAVVQLTVDGTPLPLAALVAPFRVNPGHHLVVLVTDHETIRREVDLLEKETVPVSLALYEPAAPPPTTAAPAAALTPVDTGASSSPGVSWLRWGGIGLAVAGVGVGSVAGVMSLNSTKAASRGCVNNACPPATWGDIDSARTTATISTVAFSAAGVGGVLALVSLLVHGRSEPPPTHDARAGGAGRVRTTLWLDSAGAGVRGTF
jgi:hypothetical protein